MRVLVTGAGGMLGRDVVRAVGARGHEPLALGRGDLDITDPAAVNRIVGSLAAELPGAPELVIVNCAAWTDVDGAEANEAEALRVNGDGPRQLAEAASAHGVRLIHVSTDYVFDGVAERPYVESDPPSPQSGYGRTKLAGERGVLARGGAHAVVRSSWLFGLGGRNFVATMLAAAADGREEVAVVTDQVGCPTYTAHLAVALVEIAEAGVGGILHVAGSGRCSWHEFAQEIFSQAGVSCRVVATTSREFRRPAQRPAWSVLGSERSDAPHLSAWQDGLREYLSESRIAVAK
jgi:dTDP-4-dehydrorhamnose reductase